MKKFVMLMLVGSLIGSLQARNLEINVAMAEKESNFEWTNDEIRLEVVATPCEECCKEVEVAVYDVQQECLELIAKPCLKMQSSEVVEVCIGATDENDNCKDTIKITVESTPAEESYINVRVQE